AEFLLFLIAFSGILGGKTAKPHSRPYMASLQVRGAHTCGGFLIREDFILTAAHCIYGLDERVKNINLPSEGENISSHTQCLIPGWGRRKPGGVAEKILREVSVSIKTDKECKKWWQKYYQPKRMLCTFDSKKGICQGDSGGPLVCKDTAYGIAALTAPNCNLSYPSIYTKVSSFIAWINEIMNEKY
uniref:Peptidase S1 domain-containing protein n=1 Tax=Paramormyrops kingsleyae TaxID=1676925 RepID=A0A3B3SK81_9TELE